MAYNYKLTIGYDGARYQGWQKNKNAKETIQSKLEAVIAEVVGEKVQLVGSGRTDKGGSMPRLKSQISSLKIDKNPIA